MLDRDPHDVAGLAKPRVRVPNLTFTLKAFGAQPLIEFSKTRTAMVGLRDHHSLDDAISFYDARVLDGIGYGGDRFRDVHRRILTV